MKCSSCFYVFSAEIEISTDIFEVDGRVKWLVSGDIPQAKEMMQCQAEQSRKLFSLCRPYSHSTLYNLVSQEEDITRHYMKRDNYGS